LRSAREEGSTGAIMQHDASSMGEWGVEDCRDGISAESGCDAAFKESKELGTHLESACEQRAREERQAKMLAEQREEILRYKWIESEKAHRDLGSDAVLDWIRRYAAQWRRWYDDQRHAKKRA
jgi:hypothetical protein